MRKNKNNDILRNHFETPYQLHIHYLAERVAAENVHADGIVVPIKRKIKYFVIIKENNVDKMNKY